MKKISIFICLVLAVFSFDSLKGQSIENVRFEQKGNKVFIYYDLINSGDTYYNVDVYYSTDGGQNFYNQVQTAHGDIGESISGGRNQQVIWDVLKDLPQINSSRVVFKVNAKPIHSLATFEINDCLFELKDCKKEGNKIVLNFDITNKGSKRVIGLRDGRSYIYDTEGNKIKGVDSGIGGNSGWHTEILSNITTKGFFEFDGNTFVGKKIVAADLVFDVGDERHNHYEIRNISIK